MHAGAGGRSLTGTPLVDLDRPVVVEHSGDHRGPDVVGRVELAVPCCSWEVSTTACTSRRTPPGATAASSARSAAASEVRSSAGYIALTRSKYAGGSAASASPALTQRTDAPSFRACPAATSSATVETSSPVTSQPRWASQMASAPSPQPTSSTRPGVSAATSATSAPFGQPLPSWRTGGPTPRAPQGHRRSRRRDRRR